ncbi:MAG TPA: CPBP family intramembrane glutamic endopeptidase [Kofleriaceae bacterium]
MNPGIVDHIIAFIIIVAMPILSVRAYRLMVAAVRADPNGRRRQYQWIIVQQWLAVAILLGFWFAVGRGAAAIGLDLPRGLQTLIGLAITTAVVVALLLQRIAIRRGGETARESLRAQIEAFDALAPRTQAELRWFNALSVTAGICEEVLYRGFLLAYLGALLGIWPAVVAGAVTFGVAHLYQGRANALKGVIFSLLLGALYVGCGTLLWPIILHAALDLHGGALARFALADTRD